ncbi:MULTISPECIES: hypothetical protein [unclassified Pseudomonas]|uniref:hypothetical protein n=1 Tax=unclassified Pseudomonas TaxID=196821 RepID=UPI000F70CD58|nr:MULTISPECIES: hypothetical protein [unclassified Pseudomonas]AZF22393.1 hypothetical protein C4J91_3655 [Pseudomonas sp. R3-52-08]AZF27651.1 hypothetical protein C4J90_3490 [Pseudomonas sp. R2-60-08W]
MSLFPINNIARVIDVRPSLPIDALTASNETAIRPNVGRESVRTMPVMAYGDRSQSLPNVGIDLPLVNAIVALFNSLFTQLLALVADKKDKHVPDTNPLPPLIIPQVTPQPVLPRPDAAANIPGLSNKRGGAKPDNIWSGFRQGPDGNCVTVSAIKAAMYRFGQSPTDIFKEVTKTNDGYQVLMRDGFRLTLTDRELADGARGAKFSGPDTGMLKDAQFLFAVSAKRAQMENNDRTAGRSFQAAIRSLNDGEDESGPGEGFLRLGLKGHMKRVSVRELAQGQIGMCNRTGHSVAVINGREELWGKQGRVPTHGHAVALM